MESLTGLTFEKPFRVFITHPGLRNGAYYGDGVIAWGCTGDFPNYDLVYLWHEILHGYIPEELFKDELEGELAHCLIQLLTDNTLRTYLSPEENFFPLVGHPYLDPMMQEVYPYWEEYLKREDKNILAFLDELHYLFKDKYPDDNIVLE